MGLFGPSRKKLKTEIEELRSNFLGFIQTAFGGVDIPSLNMGAAMKSSAVWACVRIIARSIANLPFNVFQNMPDGTKLPAFNKNLQTFLNLATNPSMTAFSFKETLLVHLLLRGNAFIWKKRDEQLRVTALYPLYPDRVMLHLLPDGTKEFHIAGMTFDSFDILHIPGISLDGFAGISVISLLDTTILRDIAIGEFSRKFFENGAYPSGVLEVQKGLSDVAYARLKASWDSMHQGSRNAHKVAILEDSVSYKPLQISPKDSQLIETKASSVEDIARIFGVPLHMVHVAAKAPYANNEQQSLEFLTHTIQPWIVSLENAFNVGLFSLLDVSHFSVRADVDSLLRADIKTRMDAYSVGRQIGLYSINDIRALENLNPIPNGDQYNLMIPGAPTPLNAEAPTETEEQVTGDGQGDGSDNADGGSDK